jgi:hypothetical protein
MSWLERTGQRWKVLAFGLFFVLPGLVLAALFFVPWTTVERDRGRMMFELLLTAVAVIELLLFLATLRCPRCRKSAGRWALSNKQGVPRLWAMQECPFSRSRD